MADLQHFCLRWNNYQSSITSAFENLRDDEDFVDVTLACDGKSLKAHRVVLSACSPYFRELLKSTPCKHPVIVLQDVIFEDLHALVEFIYHGEVNVHQKALPSFLKTAEVLRVSGLTQQSEVREEVADKTRDSPEENWLAYHRTPTTPSFRHRERRPSASENTDNQESNSAPSKKIKPEQNNSSGHNDTAAHQLPNNLQEKEDGEPPVDFSKTNQSKASGRESSPGWEHEREDTRPMKPEPMECGGGPGGGGGGEADDSNESQVISESQIATVEPDETAISAHQQMYFEKGLGGLNSLRFSMAAALAADTYAAGLNNQAHVTSGGDSLAGTSQGWRVRPDNKLVCDVCNKSYRTMNSLRNHRSIYHRKLRVESQSVEPQMKDEQSSPDSYWNPQP